MLQSSTHLSGTVAHPTEVLPPQEVTAVAAGPAIYLFALTLFGYRLTGALSKRKLFGTLGCVVVGFAGLFLPALVLAGLLIVVLVAVIGSDRKSTRLNSSHANISYAVFCLKK